MFKQSWSQCTQFLYCKGFQSEDQRIYDNEVLDSVNMVFKGDVNILYQIYIKYIHFDFYYADISFFLFAKNIVFIPVRHVNGVQDDITFNPLVLSVKASAFYSLASQQTEF